MKKILLFLFGLLLIISNPLIAQVNSGGLSPTPITSATLPYTCNFEDPTENSNWVISNGTATSKFFIGAISIPTAPISGNALFISSDNGVTPSYILTSTNVAVASRTIEFNGAPQYQLNFDVHIGGENSSDYIKVFVVDVDTTYNGINGSTPYFATTAYSLNQYITGYNGTNQYFNGYNGSSIVASVYSKQLLLPSQGSTNTVKKLVFVWRNDSYNGTLPPAIIDNITLTPIWCPAPTSIVGTNVTNNSINLSWTEIGSATLWNLEYKMNYESTWTEVLGLTTHNYLLANLNTDSIYNVRIKSNCGTDTSSYSNVYNFTTISYPPATIPYSQDFENSAENSFWKMINGIQTNKFFIGDASLNPNLNNTNGGSNALYISNDSLGATWAYSGTTTATNSWVYAYRDFTIPAGVSELKLDFDWIANGGVPKSEFLRVYWMPTSIPITAGSVPPTINSVNYDLIAQIGNYTNGYGEHWLSGQTTWQHATFNINTTQYPNLANNTWRLYVHWRNNQTTAVQPPATIDNMTLVVSNCLMPKIDSVSNITQNSASLYFTEYNTSTTWNVQYRILGSTQWTSITGNANPFIINGLQPSTTYEVRIQTNCTSEQSTWSPIKTFNTSCGTITQVPWYDYFDNYGTGTTVFPSCWTRKSNVSFPVILTTNYTSPGSMFFNAASSGKYNIASTPMIDATIPINTLMLDFYFRANGLDDTLYVGVMTNPLDETTFTLVDKFVNTATNVFFNKTLYLNQYQGIGQYISFKTQYGASSSGIYIDNLQILPMPSCMIPNTISASNATAYDVTINWLPGDATQTAWFIYYKPTAVTTWDSVEVISSPYLLDNLLPSTNYQYYLRANCGTELSDATAIGTFTTQCIPITTLPWNDGFESISAVNQLPACWAATSLGSKTFTQITNYNTLNRNARSGTSAAYFKFGSDDRFFTPGFQLDAGVTYKFSYWYVTDGYSGWTTLQAGAYSIQNAGGLIQTLNTITAPTDTTYQEVVCYFTPTTDGEYYFGIYCQSTYSVMYLTIDDISLDFAPDCLQVYDLAVNNIAGNSALVTWTPSGTPDFFNIAISPAGQNVWSTVTTNSNQYILTGLTELTAYDVQVYPNCSGFEGPSDTVTFTTTCAAGGELIVGTPIVTTSTNGALLPTQTYDKYSYTQQIFDATELLDLDTIHNIAFQYFFNTPTTRNLTIYLGHTLKSAFSSVLDFVPIDSMVMVYQGPVELINNGVNNWVTINLTTPFNYNTVDNLVIAVNDTTGDYASFGEKFRTHSVTGNKSIYFHQNANPINPLNPTALTSGVSTYRNNIKITLPCETATCFKPNIIVDNITSSSASFIIIPGGSETTWEGEYKAINSLNWISLGTITTSPYSLSGLTSNTAYQIRLRSVCSITDTSEWKTVEFTTSCGTITQLPFTENFDSYSSSTNAYPTCWTRNSSYGPNPYVNSNNALSAPNSFYFFSSPTTYSMIILPPVDPTIPLNTLQLTLWARMETLGNSLKVGVISDPYDASTFNMVGSITPTSLSTMEEFTISFANYIGSGTYIAIKSDLIAQNSSNTIYTDNYTLDLIPLCVNPINVTFSDIYTTTTTASWTPVTQAPEYEVVYGLPGIDPNTAIPIVVTDTFYTMSSLSANTLYHFYVRAKCSATNSSDWTLLSTFNTACDVISTLPWSDYFDTYGTGTTVFPQCWIRNTTQTDRPNISSTNFSAPGSMYFSTGSAGVYNIAATPMFNSSIAINTLKAEFKYRSTYSSDTIYVGVMTDPLDATSFVQIAAIGNTSTSIWYDKEVDFSSYTGNGHYIAFKNSNATTYSFGYIDNLTIMLNPTCPRPILTSTSNATPHTIDLNWTEVGFATSWQIEYGTAGFTIGTGNQVVTNVHPYTVPSLTPSTVYDFYVRAICGPGDTSIWSVNTVGETTCLLSTLPVFEGFETSTNLPTCWTSVATSTNISIVTTSSNPSCIPHGGSNMVYYNSYNIPSGNNAILYSPLITLTGAPVIISYWQYRNPDYSNYLTEGIEVFYNSTNSTIGATSLGFTPRYFATAGWYQIIDTIPAGITGSKYFMFKITSENGNNQFIDDISMDYLILLCSVPTNLAVSGITSSTANVSWTVGDTETQWEIAYKSSAAASWNYALTTTPNYALPSLNAATAYEVKVRAICGVGDTSAYTSIVNFTTGAQLCNSPTNVTANTITTSGATITWTASGTETSWELDYKLASTSTWTTVTVNASPSQVLNTLLPATAYNVRVRAICGPGLFSAYTSIVNFTTATPPCNMPTNVQISNATITNQTAIVTWEAGGTETSWQVDYKLVASSNWTTTTTTAPTLSLQSLATSSTYEVRVKALCGATSESDFTTPVQFTTAGPTTYIITAAANNFGTISPSGNIVVNAGDDQSFVFIPNTDCTIDSLIIDEGTIPYTQTTYTFTSVNANRSITAIFIDHTAIEESTTDQLVKLYPNPTNSYIDLILDENLLQVKECKVFDIYGKLLKVVSVNSDHTRIDVSDFAAGVYFVRMNTEKGLLTKKFVNE